jgi:K(+)-stimulated pyrophosphate-energized sodium pump
MIVGAIVPEIVKIFTSVKSAFVQNVVTSSKHGGASLNVLAGLTAGNFSAYWMMGIAIIILMSIAYVISLYGLGLIMIAPAVFAFGLVAFACSFPAWFTGSSNHAVTSGAYKAVGFIKNNIKLSGSSDRASAEDSKKVVGICTKYAQKGMINLFLAIFFTTLSFAFIEPYFNSIVRAFQAIFMANVGGVCDDNAKKYVEVNLCEKGTELHKATVVGDTVGDPFKDTSSLAMNPIIKFTTLFGLLALELALRLAKKRL